MYGIFMPAAHRDTLPDAEIDADYKRLRWQVFAGIFIGYAGYYLVRKNFSLAVPFLIEEEGYSRGELGIAMSAISIAYGLSKFLMGSVSDRSNPRFFLPAGLLMSAGLMFLFGLQLAWLPTFGYGDGGIQYLLLPAFTLGIAYMALLARTTRAAVIEVMASDFIRTARAKGLSEFQIVRRHLLRNTLVLILTTAGLQFGTMMGQAVIVEKLFAWPGLGTLLVDSVFLRDIPLIQGCILVFVSFFLIINTVTDLLYSAIDPRIRHS